MRSQTGVWEREKYRDEEIPSLTRRAHHESFRLRVGLASSPCHLVALSPCHLVALSPCHLVTLSPCGGSVSLSLLDPPYKNHLKNVVSTISQIKTNERIPVSHEQTTIG